MQGEIDVGEDLMRAEALVDGFEPKKRRGRLTRWIARGISDVMVTLQIRCRHPLNPSSRRPQS
jgi:hypothetical protein